MTKLCRFNSDRLGLIDGDDVLDVTCALDILPSVRWPLPRADLLISNLGDVLALALAAATDAKRVPLSGVKLLSPVANPSKVIAAPVNYLRHQAEANADSIHFGKDVKTIEHYGLFLKSVSSIVGTGEGVQISLPARRTDHEIELVVVIGKKGRSIATNEALDYVAGYTIGLDMTIRGPEDRSLRKSLDTFSVLGPWLVTADEIADPNALDVVLAVNGEMRQAASTSDLILNVQELIAYASRYYTLLPGDLLFTGTPEGVGAVVAGDRIDMTISRVGKASVRVTAAG